ncbi:Wzz/FepE/Etk N-terminal domain-containing protein [Lysinibacillus sp. KU-BSD001]|uniref:YveK family protein n=1 Tax=Lysinibacillus sp. KU-BSD001 TaxID=3141328 RepID=UPI0036EC7154
MEETISLQEILKIIKKRLLLIISLIVVAISIAAYISFYVITPTYEAQTQILVNQKNIDQEYSWSQMEADLQLINTYNVIITSPIILNKVIEELNLDVTSGQLASQISVSNESNSKVVNITVQNDNPKQAVDIANTIAEVFQAEIPFLMSVNNLTILSVATLSETPIPIKPNKTMNIAIATLVGLMAGIGLAFLLEMFDVTIKTEKDVEEIIQLPIMGLVGSMPLEKKKHAAFKSRRMKGDSHAWVEKES